MLQTFGSPGAGGSEAALLQTLGSAGAGKVVRTAAVSQRLTGREAAEPREMSNLEQ